VDEHDRLQGRGVDKSSSHGVKIIIHINYINLLFGFHIWIAQEFEQKMSSQSREATNFDIENKLKGKSGIYYTSVK